MGVRTRRARKHARTHIVGFSAAGIFGFIALFFIALFISLGGLIDIWLQDLPNYKSADAYLVAEPTEILDSNGQVIADYFLQNRKSVTMDQVSPYVLKGTVDTEDARFYTHGGIDLQGILRAVIATARGGSEGASTITQQLVRNTVLSKEQFDKTIKRKIREAYIATEMEKIFTKDQILMMYLNTIYYGHGAYGIEAAAQTYFNKHAKDLTLPEAATLSGLPQSPSYYDPTKNLKIAEKRRNIVLNRMYTMGDITKEEFDKALATPLKISLGATAKNSDGSYPYFTRYVKSVLEKDFKNDTIMQGGLKIYTTLDQDIQKKTQDAVQKTLKNLGLKDLQQAAVVMDPKTGYVKAIVGGREWDAKHQFNIATQAKRQPGSSFKMFTLATAISNGMNPNVILNCNSPMDFGNMNVINFGNKSYGYISLARATALSSNTGFIQVQEAVGKDKIVATAKNMGIKSQLPTYDTLTLGVNEMSPLEMCEAYNTLAAGGQHRDAVVVTKIEDRNGNIVYQHNDQPSTALSPEAAAATTKVLEGVVTNGTASAIRSYTSINQPIAGKTGTTTDVKDLWFCGFTPQLTISVWTGYTNNKSVQLGGRDLHPYNTSCVTFATIVNDVLKDAPREEFPQAAQPNYKPNSTWKFSHTKTQPTYQATTPQADQKDENEQTDQESQSDTNNQNKGTNPDNKGAAAQAGNASNNKGNNGGENKGNGNGGN